MENCPWIYGDSLDRVVEWRVANGVTTDVSALAGKTVRLLFELRDADLFAIQFLPSRLGRAPTTAVPKLQLVDVKKL